LPATPNAKNLLLRGQCPKLFLHLSFLALKSVVTASNQAMTTTSDITGLFAEYNRGNREVLDDIFPLIYDELKRVAANKLKNERPGHTLQATALVHEAYIRLIGQESVDWTNRVQFFGLAAEMMRRILTNYAVARNAAKREGQSTRIELDEAVVFATGRGIDLIALDEALTELATIDLQQAKIVELRFYTGLSVDEIASLLGISPSTVKREWRMAKAWLYDSLDRK
jgi:RNA polymerase sigma factor (TIGR02999 family)